MQNHVASAATSTAFCPGIVNPQLNHWIRARDSYNALRNRPSHDWGDYKLIVVDLGQSLKDLFGMNWEVVPGERTPFLRQYIDKTLPARKGWKLEVDAPTVYANFCAPDKVYNGLCNHLDAAKTSQIAEVLSYDTLSDFIESVRQVWMWVLKKRAGSEPIPEDQLVEFPPFTN